MTDLDARVGGGRRRRIRRVDVLVVAWSICWAAMGVAVGWQVHRLDELSTTVVSAGSALRGTSAGLRSVEEIPLVGILLRRQIERVTTSVDATANQAVADGRDSRRTVDHLSVLLAVAVGMLGIAPVLALYAAVRRARVREMRAIRRALVRGDGTAVDRYLAHRAVQRLPYERLRAITPDPWGDLEAGRYRALAEAELHRLGISRTGRR